MIEKPLILTLTLDDASFGFLMMPENDTFRLTAIL